MSPGGFEGDTAFLKSDVESMRHQNDYAGSIHPQPLADGDVVYVSNDSGVHSQHETSKDDFIGSESRNGGNSAKPDELIVRKLNNSPKVDRTIGEKRTGRSRRAVTSVKEHVWPLGVIPYEIGPQFNGYSRAIILRAMRVWESLTCLSFVEREHHHKAYINFTVEDCGCCSFVGRQKESSPQTISISKGCESEGTVMHELGHALGFWHEQSRPDRDAYVQIFTDDIKSKNLFNFDKRSPDEIDSLGETYDYESIMHYHSAAFAKPNVSETIRPRECCPRPQIGQRIKPSAGDVRQMNKLYNCPSCGQTFVEFAGNFSSPQTNLFSPSAANSGEQGRYCGTDLPPTLVTQSPRMLIEYKRPAGHSGSGFAANYRIFCGGFMKADEGTFTSPGYPSNYPPSKICTWWIKVTSGFAVVLTFESIELEDQPDCPYDYIEIFDGSSDTSPAMRRICGNKSPEPIWSTNNTMEVRFVADYAVQMKGFVAKFKKVPYSEIDQCAIAKHDCEHVCVAVPGGYTCKCYDGYNLLPDGKSCQLRPCGGYLSMNNGSITTPGFPREYPPNLKCVWSIQVPDGYSVLLEFDSFELEEQFDCRSDYLEIYDGPSESSPRLRQLCGSKFPKPVASKMNKMTLKFVSDDLFSKKGFKVRFQKVLYAEIDHCITANHGCEHICVSDAGGYRCQCRDGYYLLPDGTSCQSSACGKYMRSANENITSPGFPNEYPPNSTCVWKIQVPVGYKVLFRLDFFELEDIFDCPFDYLEIYDGPSASSTRLRKMCTSKIPALFLSTTNTMTVKFVSDGRVNKGGFRGRCEKIKTKNHRRLSRGPNK
nr:unnamed protein product [Spirometra erinaceieuropaei]